jgi:hypothetical protein
MNRRLKSLAKVPFAPVVAAMFGVITLILIFMTPGWLFERLVVASGLPGLIAAAQPPLGETARKLSAIVGGLGVFGVLWAGLGLLRGFIKRNAPPKARGSRIDAAPASEDMQSPITRRKRAPIFAERELGAPFMSDEAIASVTENLPVVQPVEEIEAPEPEAPRPTTEAETPPLVLDRIVPVPNETRPKLSDELDRLQSALDRRSARGLSARPLGAGDIASLRNALRGLR